MKKYEIEINNEVYRVSVKELSADADMSDSQSVSDTDTKNPKSTEPATTQSETERRLKHLWLVRS